MKNKRIILSIIVILFVFCGALSFALYRKSGQGTGTIDAATWSISRSQNGGSLEVMPGYTTADYTLTVSSASEVDVIYTVIISNLPAEVEVALDGVYQPQQNNEIVFDDAGTINYNDSVKTKTHTLTFRAAANAQPVTEQDVDIDVEFRQGL